MLKLYKRVGKSVDKKETVKEMEKVLGIKKVYKGTVSV